MTQVHELIGLHCSEGSADKVWGATLLQDDDGFIFTAVYGGRGGAMSGKPERMAEATARKHFASKLKEKMGKGYQRIDLAAPGYGLGPALVAHHPFLASQLGQQAVATAAAAAITTTRTARVVVSHVSVLDVAELPRLVASPQWGMTEKVNGDRCTVEVLADGTLRAYNRRGIVNLAPPEAAAPLANIGVPFLVDGERLPGGRYAIFDLLEWNGESIRHMAYAERVKLLLAGLESLNLPVGPAEAKNVPMFILTSVNTRFGKQALFSTVQATGGEGVILRDMRGPDVAGSTRHVLKVKFLGELDAFVIGHTPGRDRGSLRMAVVRPDGAILEIAHVSGGQTAYNLGDLRTLGARTDRPVLAVSFLRARTPGISLVEPRFSSGVRTDKTWAECSTQQLVDVLGADRQPLIDAAKGVQL